MEINLSKKSWKICQAFQIIHWAVSSHLKWAISNLMNDYATTGCSFDDVLRNLAQSLKYIFNTYCVPSGIYSKLKS